MSDEGQLTDEELTQRMRDKLSEKEQGRAQVEGIKTVHHQLLAIPATKLDVSEVQARLESLERHVGRHGLDRNSLTGVIRRTEGRVDYFCREGRDRLDTHDSRLVGLLILIAALFVLTGVNFFWG